MPGVLIFPVGPPSDAHISHQMTRNRKPPALPFTHVTLSRTASSSTLVRAVQPAMSRRPNRESLTQSTSRPQHNKPHVAHTALDAAPPTALPVTYAAGCAGLDLFAAAMDLALTPEGWTYVTATELRPEVRAALVRMPRPHP